MTGRRRIALLRGVNVGGITVRSEPLAEVFRALGYDDVRTVLASGNVVFSGGGAEGAVKAAVEKGLADAFGYDAWIVLTDQDAVRSVAEAYPFAEVDDRQPYVIFASDYAVLDELEGFARSTDTDPETERLSAGDGVLYWEVVRGRSTDTVIAKELAKRRYRQTTTTRNLRTLRKLLAV